MIIKSLYQTKIECILEGTPTYNVDIDEVNLKVIVTLKDFNGKVVTDTPVTLDCNKGYFTKVEHNGGTTTLNKTKDTNPKNTNYQGQIIATWTASEWGLCNFTANNTSVQCNVTGWKLINSGENSGTTAKQYVNGQGVGLIQLTGRPTASFVNSGAGRLLLTITDYLPNGNYGSPIYSTWFTGAGINYMDEMMMTLSEDNGEVRIHMKDNASFKSRCDGTNGITSQIIYRYDE